MFISCFVFIVCYIFLLGMDGLSWFCGLSCLYLGGMWAPFSARVFSAGHEVLLSFWMVACRMNHN